MFSTLKVEKTKNSYVLYPTKFASSTQIHKKIIGAPNQPIETKKISKKVWLVQKYKGAKNSNGGHPTEIAGSI
jgi:hypothetical protein